MFLDTNELGVTSDVYTYISTLFVKHSDKMFQYEVYKCTKSLHIKRQYPRPDYELQSQLFTDTAQYWKLTLSPSHDMLPAGLGISKYMSDLQTSPNFFSQ